MAVASLFQSGSTCRWAIYTFRLCHRGHLVDEHIREWQEDCGRRLTSIHRTGHPIHVVIKSNITGITLFCWHLLNICTPGAHSDKCISRPFPRPCWHKFSTCVLPKTLTCQPNCPWSTNCNSSHLSWTYPMSCHWDDFSPLLLLRANWDEAMVQQPYTFNGDYLMQNHLYNVSPWFSSVDLSEGAPMRP